MKIGGFPSAPELAQRDALPVRPFRLDEAQGVPPQADRTPRDASLVERVAIEAVQPQAGRKGIEAALPERMRAGGSKRRPPVAAGTGDPAEASRDALVAAIAQLIPGASPTPRPVGGDAAAAPRMQQAPALELPVRKPVRIDAVLPEPMHRHAAQPAAPSLPEPDPAPENAPRHAAAEPASPPALELRGGVVDAAASLQRPTAPAAPLAAPPTEAAAPYVVFGPGGARLSVDAGEAGAISVRIEVHDGTADLRAAGTAAPLLAGHAGELRAALAAEGLRLGTLDVADARTGADGRGGDGRPDRDDAPPDRNPAPARRAADPAQARNGRLHVKA